MENLSHHTDLIDRLLRQNLPHYQPPQDCSDFDADRANAYLEQMLTPAEQQNYEQHLADCVACRQIIQQLVLLVDDTQQPLSTPALRTIPEIFTIVEKTVEKTVENNNSVENVLISTAKPLNIIPINEKNFSQTDTSSSRKLSWQWMLAVAAMLIMFIGIGVVVRNRWAKVDTVATTPQSPTINTPSLTPKSAESLPAANTANLPDASDKVANGKANSLIETSPISKPPSSANVNIANQDVLAKKSTVGTPNADKGVNSSTALPTFPRQSSGSEQLADVGSDSRFVDVPTTNSSNGNPLPPPEIAKNDSSSENAPNVKRPRASGIAGGIGITDRETPRTKKIQSKLFTLVNGIWIDGEYLNNDALPIIILEKDSAGYRNLLQAEPDVKNYLFSRKMILVYKGRVYKFM